MVLNLYNNNGYFLTATEFDKEKYNLSDSVAVKEICDILKYIEGKLGNEKLGEHLRRISGCIGFQMTGYLFILARFQTSLDRIRTIETVLTMKGKSITVI